MNFIRFQENPGCDVETKFLEHLAFYCYLKILAVMHHSATTLPFVYEEVARWESFCREDTPSLVRLAGTDTGYVNLDFVNPIFASLELIVFRFVRFPCGGKLHTCWKPIEEFAEKSRFSLDSRREAADL